MTLEFKDSKLEFKFAGVQDSGEFEGLAAAYGNVDSAGDIIAPGAFAQSLADHKAAGTWPALLWQHDMREPIGVIDALSETPAGLQIKGRLDLNVRRASEAHSLLKSGALRGLSIGFRTIDAARNSRGVRTITKAYLGEISIVTLAANQKAMVTNIKSGNIMEDDTVDNIDVKALNEKIEALEAKGAKLDDLEQKFADAQKRADAFELKLNRPGAVIKKEDRGELEMKSFTTFVRRGREALDVNEVKSLRVSDDTTGGYLAPQEFSREVDKNIVQFSPIRMAARVGSTASGSVVIPRRTSAPTASWVGETETRSATQSAYGQIEIEVHEIACYIDVSNRLLEDAAVDIASEVAFDLAEEFGRAEGEAFVDGDGVKRPLGFMSDSSISYTPGTDASAVKTDGLIDIFYALAPAYRQRGTWVMNGSTLAAVRKLKDSTGQYLWQPALTAGQPEMILGRPVVEATDMPDVAGNAYPIAFGDFAAGYRIYDRVALSLLRDPYSQATSGLTRFHARRRVGGAVVRAEAIRKLKIATS